MSKFDLRSTAKRKQIDRALGVTSCAIAFELAEAEPVQNCFGNDRSCRVSRAAIFAKAHEASAGEDADVKGERVLRQFEPSRDVARCHALWALFPYIEKYGRMV